KAIHWGVKALKHAGADSVWLQPVEVPYWVRGKESLKIKFPDSGVWEEIQMLSLGNSEGTKGKILEAPIILIEDFDALKTLTEKEVSGKIVFYNHRFPQELINTFEAYGKAGAYRWLGPSLAAAKGAAAVIIRSISTRVDDVPHTGSMRYADTVRKIPAAAIGNSSADRLEAACKAGTVKAQLVSIRSMKGTKQSFNVVGELKGKTFPEEIVLAGGHLDSSDVGEGAHDDGAGCVQSIEIMQTFTALGIR